jgi:hypothetical protein
MSDTPDFTIKAGATFPPLAATLTDAAGVPIPLTAATVHFRMKPTTGGGAVVDHAAAIVSDVAGTVRYDWQAGDTDVPGYYRAEFRIVWSTGAVQPVPSDAYLTILVAPGLG